MITPERNEKPPWPAHDDDGVWYCDAHGSYQCRKCAEPTRPAPEGDVEIDRAEGGSMTARQAAKLAELKRKRRILGGATTAMVFDLLILLFEIRR